MTDLERLKAFLDGAGVEYREDPRSEQQGHLPDGRPNWVPLPGTEIRVEQCINDNGTYRDNPKVNGYSMFFGTFDFDADGSLIEIGFWE